MSKAQDNLRAQRKAQKTFNEALECMTIWPVDIILQYLTAHPPTIEEVVEEKDENTNMVY